MLVVFYKSRFQERREKNVLKKGGPGRLIRRDFEGDRNEKASWVWPSEAFENRFKESLQTISVNHSSDCGNGHANHAHKHGLAIRKRMRRHAQSLRGIAGCCPGEDVHGVHAVLKKISGSLVQKVPALANRPRSVRLLKIEVNRTAAIFTKFYKTIALPDFKRVCTRGW